MKQKVLVSVLTYNEGEKLKILTGKFPPEREFDVLFVDDGSTDGTRDFLRQLSFKTIYHDDNLGVGAGIRSAIEYARGNEYDVIVIMAGNGKMLPEEICRLTTPILDDQADYIQGSRYLDGGAAPNLPFFRGLGIKIFTRFTGIVLGYRATDITCGFRAYRLSIFDNPEVDISQTWLGRYEMEYYIHYKAVKLGYRVYEKPVSMVYPKDGKNYTKIKPFVGWWSMIRPWIYLSLKIKS